MNNGRNKKNIIIIVICIVAIIIVGLSGYFAFNRNKLEKITYKGSNEEVGFFEIPHISESSNDITYNYYAYYNDETIIMEINEFNNDENYASYYGGGGQCAEHNFLINKKTKEIVKYDNVGLGFIKTNKGYYFTRDNNSECHTEYSVGIYTTDWKLLGTGFENYLDTIDSDGNIYVIDKDDIVKYSINGNELLRNTEYKEIGNGVVVNGILYAIVKDNNNVIYLLNLNENFKVEIPTKNGEFIDIWFINILNNNSGLSISWYNWDDEEEVIFKYDFSTKKLEKVKE